MADIVTLLTFRLADVQSADPDLIRSTVARAARFAPCLTTEDFPSTEAALGVLKDVIQRRFDRTRSGVEPGISLSKQMGERSLAVDARGVADVLFQPAEIAELQALCSAATSGLPSGAPVGSFPAPQPWPC